MDKYKKLLRASRLTPVLIMLAYIVGCAEGTRPEATGKGAVRAIHAIVEAPELAFLNEEKNIGGVDYRRVLGFQEWDDLEYNFNFDFASPGQPDPTRLATEFIDVVADMEYTLVITGTIENPSIMMWEEAKREWTDTDTVYELDFVHVSPLLGEVDIYYDAPDIEPVLGNEIGTISNGERIPFTEFPEGPYQLIVTAPDDPSTVLFQSTTVIAIPGQRITLVLFDPDPSITASIGINAFFSSGENSQLADIGSPPQVRTMHVAFGTDNFDGYLNNDLENIVFPNVSFGELSNYVDLAETIAALTLTAVGDTTQIIKEGEITRINNSKRSLILWGSPDELFIRDIQHSARPVSTYPQIRITNLSSNISMLDLYELEAGTAINEDVSPNFSGAIAGITTNFVVASSGSREFTITLNDEQNPISTPVVLELANGEVVDMVIVDTADPYMVELVVFDTIP